MTVYCPACLELSRKNEKSWPPLQSQMNMVPIVQLVRASDCGSECRRFESDWAPFQKSLKFLNFRDFFFMYHYQASSWNTQNKYLLDVISAFVD